MPNATNGSEPRQTGEIPGGPLLPDQCGPSHLAATQGAAGDPPELAAYFLAKFGEENGLDLHFAPSAFDVLCRCAFPGNVRELENCVRRTAALAAATEIQDNARSLWREQSIEKLRSDDYSGWAIRQLASSMPLTQILPSTTAVGKDRNWAPSQGPPVQNPDCALNFA
jgi:hypothetical protein